MTNEALDALLDDLPGAGASYPFGPQARVHKVGGRIFAIVAADAAPGSITIKCDPFEAEALRRTFPAITAGYHMNKRHWITIVLDGTVPDALVDDLVSRAYELVFDALSAPRRAWALASPNG